MSASDAKRYLYRALDLVGDGSGAFDMAVDGSVAVKTFMIKPGVTEVFTLERINIAAASSNWNDATLYGTLTLANGMRIYLGNDEGVMLDYTIQQRIKAWPHWGLLAGSDVPVEGNAGSDPLNVRWTFEKGTGGPIELVGAQGDYLAIDVADNMSGLDYHYAMVQGIKNLS